MTIELHGISYLILNGIGRSMSKGDTVTDFRGEDATLKDLIRGPEYNGTAKVSTDRGDYYAQVFDLHVFPVDSVPWGVLVDHVTGEPIRAATRDEWASGHTPKPEGFTPNDWPDPLVFHGPDMSACGHTEREHSQSSKDALNWAAGHIVAMADLPDDYDAVAHLRQHSPDGVTGYQSYATTALAGFMVAQFPATVAGTCLNLFLSGYDKASGALAAFVGVFLGTRGADSDDMNIPSRMSGNDVAALLAVGAALVQPGGFTPEDVWHIASKGLALVLEC
jgi:hypothetical protein